MCLDTFVIVSSLDRCRICFGMCKSTLEQPIVNKTCPVGADGHVPPVGHVAGGEMNTVQKIYYRKAIASNSAFHIGIITKFFEDENGGSHRS